MGRGKGTERRPSRHLPDLGRCVQTVAICQSMATLCSYLNSSAHVQTARETPQSGGRGGGTPCAALQEVSLHGRRLAPAEDRRFSPACNLVRAECPATCRMIWICRPFASSRFPSTLASTFFQAQAHFSGLPSTGTAPGEAFTQGPGSK